MKKKSKISKKNWREGEPDLRNKRDEKSQGNRVRDYIIEDMETQDAMEAHDVVIRGAKQR